MPATPIGDHLRFAQTWRPTVGLVDGRHSRRLNGLTSGKFAGLSDPERLAGKLHRAYSELDGEPAGTSIDIVAAMMDMIELNGGHPMRTLV